MSRKSLRVAALGLFVLAVALTFGSKDEPVHAQSGHGDSATHQTIYPAGGSDGPPSP